jgi:hypothetical protein
MSEKWGRLSAFGFASFFGIWSLCMMLLLANPIVGRHSFSSKTETGTAVSDFVNLYKAGYITLSDQRTKAYDPDVQVELTNRLIAPDRIDRVFHFQYLPYVFPLMAPLAVVPMETAYALFYVFSLVVTAAVLTLIINDTQRFLRRDKIIILLAVLSSAPAIAALKQGQTSWLLLSFLCLFYFGVKHKRQLLGGVSLAMLTIKPQYVPLLIVSMLSARRWQLILTSFAVEAALLIVAGFTIGWDNIINYPSMLLNAETSSANSGVYPEAMVSWRMLLGSSASRDVVLVGSVIAFALAALAVYKLWQMSSGKRLPEEWAMALTTVLCLIASPHCHVHDLLFLALPAVLTLPNLSLITVASLPSIPLRIWSTVLMSYPALSWFAFCLRLPWLFLSLNVILLVSGLLHVLTIGKLDQQAK